MVQPIGIDVGVAHAVERNSVVEKLGCVANDGSSSSGVVCAASLLPVFVTDGVGSVQGIVQTAPTRVRSVECKSSIGYRNNQLWPGSLGELPIDIPGLDLERLTGGHHVADAT